MKQNSNSSMNNNANTLDEDNFNTTTDIYKGANYLEEQFPPKSSFQPTTSKKEALEVEVEEDDDNESTQRIQNSYTHKTTTDEDTNNDITKIIPPGATSLMGLFSQNSKKTNRNRNGSPSTSSTKTINWSQSVLDNDSSEKYSNSSNFKKQNNNNATGISWKDRLSSRDRNNNHVVLNEQSSLLPSTTNNKLDDDSTTSKLQQQLKKGDYNTTTPPLLDIFDTKHVPPSETKTVALDDMEKDMGTLPQYKNNYNYTINTPKYKRDSSWNTTPPMNNNTKHKRNQFPPNHNNKNWKKTYKKIIQTYGSFSFLRTTFIGSITFALYHCVFCLAMASSVSRPFKKGGDDDDIYSVLGPMTQMGALGPILIAPLLIPILGSDHPALYPSLDLFLAPFTSHMAKDIDESLYLQGIDDPNDTIFLATFSALNGIGLLFSATLCILASRVKLANFGAFLPYPVLCGFFSTVGLLLWTLAISVDTNGLTIPELMSGDASIIWSRFLLHHIPSLIIGTAMYFLRQMNSIYLVVLILLSIVGTYFVMFVTGTSLESAQEQQWFWAAASFTTHEQHGLSPPAPFGVLGSLFQPTINLQALFAGTKTVCAMAFIYALRCSILAPAMKKNTATLKGLKIDNDANLVTKKPNSKLQRDISDSSSVDSYYVELATHSPTSNDNHHHHSSSSGVKKLTSDLYVLLWFGNSQILSAFSGSFACVPSTGAAITMYKLGAGGKAPQFGSILILLYFYLSDFQLVSYIPKMVFSSLLINTFLDLIVIYFYRSFHKTKQKWEWVVGVPMIMIFSQLFGMLLSIAIGVGLSTFIFVASFYRTGVVKFVGNGLTVRSTIERIGKQALWLDRNGDLIQVLVLQNYLFFGNASSCTHYIESMFEEPDVPPDFPLPPIPKVIVLDFAIVTGIDTSTVDVFDEIIRMCDANGCSVYMSGLSPTIKSVLAFGGVKPGGGAGSSARSHGTQSNTKKLVFFPNMESALGKAEDQLIKEVYQLKEKDEEQSLLRTRKRLLSQDDDGFLYALQQVDEQHGISFAKSLGNLTTFTKAIELSPGDSLFGSDNGREPERGLFFIEYGTLKVERDPTYTISRSINNVSLRKVDFLSHKVEAGSISNFNARTRSVGKELAMLKGVATKGQTQRATHSFRLASYGPGWVVGMTEGCSGMRNPGLYCAVTKCRLHHLPYHTIQNIEEKDPRLILQLFKMLSHLNARRQDLTIEQLSILHAINSSRAPTKPLSRSHMAAVNRAMSVKGFVSS